MNRITYLLFLSVVLLMFSCTKNENQVKPLHNNSIDDKNNDGIISLHLPNPVYTYVFDDRTTPDFVKGWKKVEITNHLATLGRVLFYDNNLSVDNSISCGSCHQQKNGFADNEKFSPGAKFKNATRNSMALVNLLHKQSYFWDGRTDSLTEAVLFPILNSDEMGMPSMEDLVHKLNEVDYYDSLFYNAFESSEISKEKIAKALAAFVGSIPNMKSKKDKAYYRWLTLTEEETRGFRAVMDFGCTTCHGGYNVGGYGRTKVNLGEFSKSNDEGNEGDFFAPSLRNVAITQPYMHDGSLETLEDVLDFYRSEDFNPSSKDPDVKRFINYRPKKKVLDMTDDEVKDIIAYLKTLTDEELIADKRFCNPFY